MVDEMKSYEKKNPRSSSLPLVLIVALVGAVVGGLLVGFWFQNSLGLSTQDHSSYENSALSQSPVLVSEKNPIVPVVDEVSPAVVGITNKALAYDWFNRPRIVEAGSGSGVLFQEDGYIATNHHVIEGAREIVVTMTDGNRYPGRIVGLDPVSDLAVVKIEGETPFPVIEFGDSENVKVGETAIAIGNPLGFDQTVTVGVISAINRSLRVDERTLVFLQTDAAINAGNSGGPLVNVRGEVIGINTAKIPGVGIEGLGFAIPSSTAVPVLEELVESGRIARPWIGVVLADRDLIREYDLAEINLDQGILVMEVVPGSPADRAGFRTGDIILELGGISVDSVDELQDALREKRPGQIVLAVFERNGAEQEVSITLGEAPAE